jgi:hypothetical protein
MSQYLKIAFVCCLFFALIGRGLAQETDKLRVAILEFTNTGGLSKQETETLGNRLRSMLVKTNAFVVLERGQMDEILNEQGFQQTGCTTTECAVEMGRMLNVEKMISGTIGKLGRTYTIDLSMIDVETAQIEKSFFRDFKGEIDGLLNLMQVVANQMAQIVYQKESLKKEEGKIVAFEINSDPEQATIYINGRGAGETPFKSNAKEGIMVTIRLEKENFKPWEKTMMIKEGATVDVELEYNEAYLQAKAAADKEGGSSLWWWIGGGALVVGGAAVLLMSGSASEEDSPTTTDQGFPSPPDRPSQ